jgi:hypothetical protein
MSGEFKSVSLSKPLYELILKFIEDHPEYRSVADFVSESARVRMQEITKLCVVEVGYSLGKPLLHVKEPKHGKQ